VHDAATVVLEHQFLAPSGSFWRRWFDKPGERHLADEVRAFVTALDFLLDVPSQLLDRSDLVRVGEDVDSVIRKIEAAIDDPAMAAAGAAPLLAPAVYVIRRRHEELYQRGAGKT
jgi:hypothetical protein